VCDCHSHWIAPRLFPFLAEQLLIGRFQLGGYSGLNAVPSRSSDARRDRDIDAVFEKVAQLRAGALVIGADPFFTGRSQQLAKLTVDHAVPTIYEFREFAAAGGLISYGTSIVDAYRLAGVYTGRILKGEKPSDLPVQRATKVELILNLKTAKALGIAIPLPLVGRADEVVE
jgi:putative ABC transport system substrate-binding protein